jgi:hypothetical protein
MRCDEMEAATRRLWGANDVIARGNQTNGGMMLGKTPYRYTTPQHNIRHHAVAWTGERLAMAWLLVAASVRVTYYCSSSYTPS